MYWIQVFLSKSIWNYSKLTMRTQQHKSSNSNSSSSSGSSRSSSNSITSNSSCHLLDACYCQALCETFYMSFILTLQVRNSFYLFCRLEKMSEKIRTLEIQITRHLKNTQAHSQQKEKCKLNSTEILVSTSQTQKSR